MKKLTNKFLIGFLFVFGIVLVPIFSVNAFAYSLGYNTLVLPGGQENINYNIFFPSSHEIGYTTSSDAPWEYWTYPISWLNGKVYSAVGWDIVSKNTVPSASRSSFVESGATEFIPPSTTLVPYGYIGSSTDSCSAYYSSGSYGYTCPSGATSLRDNVSGTFSFSVPTTPGRYYFYYKNTSYSANLLEQCGTKGYNHYFYDGNRTPTCKHKSFGEYSTQSVINKGATSYKDISYGTISFNVKVVPTGVLSTPNCTIPAGSNSCVTTLEWNITNPANTTTTYVSTNVKNGDYISSDTIATGNSGTKTYTIKYKNDDYNLDNPRLFTLRHNGLQVASSSATASCVSGTAWDEVSQTCKITAPPSCFDGIKNQDETDVDTGGVCNTDATDLISLTPTMTSATVGVPKTLSSVITNIGKITTGTGFNNFFQISTVTESGQINIDKASTPMSALAYGERGTTTTTHIFTSPGSYYVRACADKTSSDGGGVINESNVSGTGENNNCSAYVGLTVISPPATPTYPSCLNNIQCNSDETCVIGTCKPKVETCVIDNDCLDNSYACVGNVCTLRTGGITVNLTASKPQIFKGKSVTLNWDSDSSGGPYECHSLPSSEIQARFDKDPSSMSSDSLVVTPTKTTTYTITCSDVTGSDQIRNVTVKVIDPIIIEQ